MRNYSKKVITRALFSSYVCLLVFFSTTVFAEIRFSLFGINLYENANEHVNQVHTLQKNKDIETDDQYFYISADSIKNKNPQFNSYFLTIDTQDTIHEIFAERKLNTSIENCVQRNLETLKGMLEAKYKKQRSYDEFGYTDFDTYEFHLFDENDNRLRIQCNFKRESQEVFFYIMLESHQLVESRFRFYEKGL